MATLDELSDEAWDGISVLIVETNRGRPRLNDCLKFVGALRVFYFVVRGEICRSALARGQ